MEKIKTLVSQHKKASLLALFALIVFIGFSATSAMNVARQRAAEETAKTESVESKARLMMKRMPKKTSSFHLLKRSSSTDTMMRRRNLSRP